MPNQPGPKSPQASNQTAQQPKTYYGNAVPPGSLAGPLLTGAAMANLGGSGGYQIPSGGAGYGTPGGGAGPSPGYYWPSDAKKAEMAAGKSGTGLWVQQSDGTWVDTSEAGGQAARQWSSGQGGNTMMGRALGEPSYENPFDQSVNAFAELLGYDFNQPEFYGTEPSKEMYEQLLMKQMLGIQKEKQESLKKVAGIAGAAGMGTSGAYASDIAGVGAKAAQEVWSASLANTQDYNTAVTNYENARTAHDKDVSAWEVNVFAAKDQALNDWAAQIALQDGALTDNQQAIGDEFLLITESLKMDTAIFDAGYTVNDAFWSDINAVKAALLAKNVDPATASLYLNEVFDKWADSGFLYEMLHDDGGYYYYDRGGTSGQGYPKPQGAEIHTGA